MSADQDINFEEILSILKKEKKLYVLNEDDKWIFDLGFGLCVHVQDENKQEYSLFINHNSNHKDLHSAKIKTKYLKTMHHSNIIQYIDDFTIGDYYFLQTERIHTSLYDWINQRTSKELLIDESSFVEIALQLCSITFYLHKCKCYLDLQQTLQCFSIDKEMKIKLIHFTTTKRINISEVKSTFNKCKENNELFFYKKYLLTMDNKCRFWHVFDLDQWAIGICLYYISSASKQHILNYSEGKESYQYQQHLGFYSNLVIFFFIYESQQLSNRPSFQYFIGFLQLQQKRLQQKLQPFKNNLQNVEEISEQMKQDFQTFLAVRKQLISGNCDINQNEILKQLIEKYEECDMLIQLKVISLAENERYEEAIDCSKEIIKINPLYDTAQHNLGVLSEIKGNILDSFNFVEKAIAINPLQELYYLNQAIVCQNQNSNDFFKYYKLAIEANCSNTHIYSNLGYYYSKRNKYYHGIQSSKQAYKINKKDEKALHYLTSDFFMIFQFEKAIRFSKLLLELEQYPENRVLMTKSKKRI